MNLGIGLAVTIPRRSGSLASQVAALFAAGMKGIWRESSRAGALFVENTGVTPVSPGSTVGLVLSLDQGLTLGPELIVDTEFDNPAAWSIGPNWTVTGGQAVATAATTGNNVQIAAGNTTIGSTYQTSIVVPELSSGLLAARVGSMYGPTITASGTYRAYLTATSTINTGLGARSAGTTGKVDSLSVREILGNHQIQSTSTARPLYQVAPPRAVFDGVDDVLNTTFSAALGTNCTVGRYVPGTGVVILTGQNIGTSFADTVTSGPLLVADRALTAGETALWTAYLTQQGTLP